MAKRSTTARGFALSPPRELAARRFRIGGDDYVLFEFPLPALDLPRVLSAAEKDVARRAIEGQTTPRIARERGTSVYTVTNQLRSIYDKLGVSSRAELARACLRNAR